MNVDEWKCVCQSKLIWTTKSNWLISITPLLLIRAFYLIGGYVNMLNLPGSTKGNLYLALLWNYINEMTLFVVIWVNRLPSLHTRLNVGINKDATTLCLIGLSSFKHTSCYASCPGCSMDICWINSVHWHVWSRYFEWYWKKKSLKGYICLKIDAILALLCNVVWKHVVNLTRSCERLEDKQLCHVFFVNTNTCSSNLCLKCHVLYQE